MEWSEAIISKIQPSIEETKQVTRNLFIESLETLQREGQIKKEVDATLIAEVLMTMYGGILDAAFTRRLVNDFDTMVTTGFNLIFNSIKTEGAK
jgi:hypothetical protein